MHDDTQKKIAIYFWDLETSFTNTVHRAKQLGYGQWNGPSVHLSLKYPDRAVTRPNVILVVYPRTLVTLSCPCKSQSGLLLSNQVVSKTPAHDKEPQ